MMNQQMTMSKQENAQKKLNIARSNLLLMVIFTLVNIVLLMMETDTVFLFSATIPYYSILFGMISEFNILYIVGICIAVITIISYLLCWFFSKKHFAWMIVALVLFIIDSLALVGLYILVGDMSGIFDLLIHIWVLYYLIIGIKYGYQLKTLPEENQVPQAADENADFDENAF